MNDAGTDRTPFVIGDPSKRISIRGALVIIALVAGLLVFVRLGFNTIVERSHEWGLTRARMVVAEASLAPEDRDALARELDRLEEGYDVGTLGDEGLLCALQRVIEGTLVPAGILQWTAAANGLDATERAQFTQLAHSVAQHDFVPVSVTPILEAVQALPEPLEGESVRALLPKVAEILEAEANAGALPDQAFDVVAAMHSVVERTLAGDAPPRLPPR